MAADLQQLERDVHESRRAYEASDSVQLHRRYLDAQARLEHGQQEAADEARRDVARRLEAVDGLLVDLVAEFGSLVQAARRERARAAVERVVDCAAVYHGLLAQVREVSADERFHYSRATLVDPRRALGDELRKLSPRLQPGPGRIMVPADSSRWAHLKLDELPIIDRRDS